MGYKLLKELAEIAKTMIVYAVLIAILSVLIFGGKITVEINFETAKQLIQLIK